MCPGERASAQPWRPRPAHRSACLDNGDPRQPLASNAEPSRKSPRSLIIHILTYTSILGCGLVPPSETSSSRAQMRPPPFRPGYPDAHLHVRPVLCMPQLEPPVALAAIPRAVRSQPMHESFTAMNSHCGFSPVHVTTRCFLSTEPVSLTLSVVTAIIGVFLLGIGTIGHYKAPVNLPLRIFAIAGALGLMIPGLKSDLAGLAVLAALHFIQAAKEKKIKASAETKTPAETGE